VPSSSSDRPADNLQVVLSVALHVGWAIPISIGGTTGAPIAASDVASWSSRAEASTSRAISATTGLGRIHVTTWFVERRLTGTPTSSPWSRTSFARVRRPPKMLSQSARTGGQTRRIRRANKTSASTSPN